MNRRDEVAVADWMTYAPYLLFDLREPFYPDAVGVTVLDKPGPSPSFYRTFEFDEPGLSRIIEYAIWWDYEIGHLYELEHVWVYVGRDGRVIGCEASFHGKVLLGLLKDRSNLADGTHVRLYSQPGKHAFSPLPDLFELLPGLYRAAGEDAGIDGLIVNDLFRGKFETNDRINGRVRQYLRQFAFTPSLEFKEYRIREEFLMPWNELYEQIPGRIGARLKELGI
ncbi:hypothetical protein ACFSL6_14465 [Paenibacillus thailandensis]|uniref:DAPG hydrolase PhiG domain-containing protein n=1 Tax=Paenibacillus thailandensis TaxID=393250 RepID=A0ABW5QQJ0_9BACL